MSEVNDLTPDNGTEQPQEEAQKPQEQIDPAPAEEQKPAIDPENDPNTIDFWKKKATAQGQENIVISKQLEEATRPKELTKEPTDSDLQAAFPEWELMTDTEKRLARGTFTATRIATSLQQKEEAREAQGRWNTDLELAIAQNPSLQGKEQAFKTFAQKPTRRGAPLDVLVAAFLHESSPNPSGPKPTPKPALEGGNGGPRGPMSSKKKYSAEEMQTIQSTDPRRYREMLLAGDFDE